VGISTDRHTWEEKLLPLNVPFTISSFRASKHLTRLEVDYAISLEPLMKKFKDEKSMEINVGITIFDKDWHQISQYTFDQNILMSKNKFAIDLFSTNVSPESYHIAMYVKPKKGNYLGGWKMKAVARDFSNDSLAVSVIIFAENIKQASETSKFNRGDLFVLPNPTKQFFRKKPIFVYFELYNLKKDEGNMARFEIEYELEKLSGEKKAIGNLFGLFNRGKSRISTSMERDAFESDSQEYLAIDVSHLKKGRYKLTVKIRDKISNQTVSRSGTLAIVD
jgi:hypothetical protein